MFVSKTPARAGHVGKYQTYSAGTGGRGRNEWDPGRRARPVRELELMLVAVSLVWRLQLNGSAESCAVSRFF